MNSHNLWLLAVAALTAWWLATRRRTTRPLSWRRARRTTDGHGEGAGFSGALRWLLLGDGFGIALRFRLARTQKLVGRVVSHVVAVTSALPELAPNIAELREASAKQGESVPTLSPKVAARLSIALYGGDIAVVSGILMAENSDLPFLAAVITSLAIATAQFAVGKLMGRSVIGLSDRARKRATLIAPAVMLVVLGISLGALLHHVTWAWAFLAVTPALGAAALTVVSHDDSRQRVYRAQRSVQGSAKSSAHVVKRLGRAVGRASSSWTRASTLLARHVTSREQAEASAAAVTEVGPDLTAHVRGTQLTVEALQVHKMGVTLDKALKFLHTLEDRMESLLVDTLNTVPPVPVPAEPVLLPVRVPVANGLNGVDRVDAS